MNLIQGPDLSIALNRPVITVGSFDGVHKGHQVLFKEVVERARQQCVDSLVITFDPHPRLVLNYTPDIRLLNTPEEKIKLIGQTGIDYLWVIPFTRSFADLSAGQFLREYILEKAGGSQLVAGYDHSFGRGGHSNFSSLKEIAAKYLLPLTKVDELTIEGRIVGSTLIREAIGSGNMPKAKQMLGYNYSLTGYVKRGNQIGKLIGYPTANLMITYPHKMIPAPGVYACLIIWKGQAFQGMGNIGYRPTIDANKLTIEANIFNFDREIYNETITIQFIERIRNEQKFGGLEQLKTQLGRDKEKVMRMLEEI